MLIILLNTKGTENHVIWKKSQVEHNMDLFFKSKALCGKGDLPVTIIHCHTTTASASREASGRNCEEESSYILTCLRADGIKCCNENTCLPTAERGNVQYALHERVCHFSPASPQHLLTMLSRCRRFLMGRIGDSKSLSFITYTNRNQDNCKEDLCFRVSLVIFLGFFAKTHIRRLQNIHSFPIFPLANDLLFTVTAGSCRTNSKQHSEENALLTVQYCYN